MRPDENCLLRCCVVIGTQRVKNPVCNLAVLACNLCDRSMWSRSRPILKSSSFILSPSAFAAISLDAVTTLRRQTLGFSNCTDRENVQHDVFAQAICLKILQLRFCTCICDDVAFGKAHAMEMHELKNTCYNACTCERYIWNDDGT